MDVSLSFVQWPQKPSLHQEMPDVRSEVGNHELGTHRIKCSVCITFPHICLSISFRKDIFIFIFINEIAIADLPLTN